MGHLTPAFLEKLLTPKHAMLLLQPIYPLSGGAPYAHEAFLRLRLPTGELVEPVDFIPVASTAGLLDTLDMLTLSLLRTQILPVANRFTGFLSLNVTAASLSSRSYLHALASPTWKHILPHLLLELPARDAMECPKIITYLSQAGIRFSVDLAPRDDVAAYLRMKEITSFKLKVSQFRPAQLTALTAAIRAKGRSVTIAQIENVPQHRAAEAAQPDYIQGFHYSEPQPKPTNAILQAFKAQSA